MAIEPDQVTADRVTQRCYMAANEEKIPLLIGLLRGMEDARVIVFANTKRATDAIWGYLEGNGLRAAILSGDVPQRKRLHLLKQFQGGELPILVATDVAARGLHIPKVPHVINFDVPVVPDDYINRVGRTARAGQIGDALTFASPGEKQLVNAIERAVGRSIPRRTIEGFDYKAQPKGRLEIPAGERIAAHRARRAE